MASKSKPLYVVKQILDKRVVDGQVEYLISWKGYGPEENSWEPITNLNCNARIKEYEKMKRKSKECSAL